ncbi:hypothetical protein HHK36_026333 [Tetracentron sinense]|uniref:Uncharacterized protein n=1 Tax=Tetracentron sinense TaxID=13715 RepID=A0A835D5D3_TETSI|nr:hypothetical protein HHK36_026333 [Tetracentron sinense]
MLNWAPVKVAEPRDCVVAVHVCRDSDNALRLEKPPLFNCSRGGFWFLNKEEQVLSDPPRQGRSRGSDLMGKFGLKNCCYCSYKINSCPPQDKISCRLPLPFKIYAKASKASHHLIVLDGAFGFLSRKNKCRQILLDKDGVVKESGLDSPFLNPFMRRKMACNKLSLLLAMMIVMVASATMHEEEGKEAATKKTIKELDENEACITARSNI